MNTKIFETEKNKTTRTNPNEIPVQPDVSNEEMRNAPGTAHECSLEIFPQTEELSVVTDTYLHMEPVLETNPAAPNIIYVIT